MSDPGVMSHIHTRTHMHDTCYMPQNNLHKICRKKRCFWKSFCSDQHCVLFFLFACFFQVESSEMKTLSLLFFFLLLASGACDNMKYISKRNSGRVKRRVILLKMMHRCFLYVCFTVILFHRKHCLFWNSKITLSPIFSHLLLILSPTAKYTLFLSHILKTWCYGYILVF